MTAPSQGNILFSFVQVPDLHLSLPDNPCNPGPVDALTPLMESLQREAFHPMPAFAVIGGDNIHGFQNDGGVICEAETRMLRERMDRFPCPSHVICHGHDTWGEPRPGECFRRLFGDDVAEFPHSRSEWPGDFVVLAMSGCCEMPNGSPESIEYDWIDFDWLDDQLAHAKGKRVLLFTHMPPYRPRGEARDENGAMRPWQACGSCHSDEQSERFIALLEQHGNVAAQYSGHCHVNSVLQCGGITYCTTASLSSDPWEYRHVEVYPDRIVHRCIAPLDVKPRPGFWGGCTDAAHPTVNIYHQGLPHERDFTVQLPPKPAA